METDWSDMATSQVTPGATKSWKRQEGSCLRAFREKQPYQDLDFRIQAFRTVRESIFVVLSPSVCDMMIQQPQGTLIQPLKPVHGLC